MANLKEIEKLLKALGNKRRLEIIRLLKNKGEHSVGLIAEGIRLSLRSTSRHLAILKSADIIDKEQRSIEVWYSLLPNQQSLTKAILNSLD